MAKDISAKTLRLKFHGRIIDHLGIQMYQSPVASVAELIANAWDADAESVNVTLPSSLGSGSSIVIEDDGVGMTYEECQDRYLNVGWCRRGSQSTERTKEKNRPVLGRKGIGKFAGFGIAQIVKIETTSKETGERTVFTLDLKDLRTGEYVSTEERPIPVDAYLAPDVKRCNHHGTKIELSALNVKNKPSEKVFLKSMARRFLLHQSATGFTITINGKPLSTSSNLSGVQFVFPQDYEQDEKPSGLLSIEEGRGVETLSNGRGIRWRFQFHKDPIDDEELRGVSVFAHGKLCQSPFLFNLTGGLGGQQGEPYLSGVVEADYLDELDIDIISPERQRVNWEHDESAPLLEWGQERVKKLLRLWKERRAEDRIRALEQKVSGFNERLDALGKHEARTVKKALTKLAQVATLSQDRYEDVGNAVLTAWEQGRLRDLIGGIADTDDLGEGEFLELLMEAQVLTALNMAEAVKTKLATVAGLKRRVESHELENAVRDYIAVNPWLISPEWETFRVEIGVKNLLQEAAKEAKMTGDDWNGRVDLALQSGSHLLVLEFMRPGLHLDWDHLSRFERYVRIVQSGLEANTGGKFRRVTGYVVADSLNRNAANLSKIKDMEASDMYALDWSTLFGGALSRWKEFLDTLASRAPTDERLQSLLEEYSPTTP